MYYARAKESICLLSQMVYQIKTVFITLKSDKKILNQTANPFLISYLFYATDTSKIILNVKIISV